MECGTQFLRYYCSKHPGANCCSDEGLLLATRQKGFINQPLGFILYDVFDIYTTFFIFHYLKEKQGGERIKDLSFARHHLKRLSWLYESFFMQSFLIQYSIIISKELNAFLDFVVYIGRHQKTTFPIFYVLLTDTQKMKTLLSPHTSVLVFISSILRAKNFVSVNICIATHVH